MRKLDKVQAPPTLADVVERLRGLVLGTMDRESVAEWAGFWVGQKAPPIPDPKLWHAVERLSGADMISTDRPFLYDKEDFEQWLKDLLA